MSIKINNHGFFHFAELFEQKVNCQRYVSIDTKTAAVIGTAMVKSTANIDRPASFDSQLRGLETERPQSKCSHKDHPLYTLYM
jgi:hypothetical protein